MRSLTMAPYMEVMRSAWLAVERGMKNVVTRGRTLVFRGKQPAATTFSLGEDTDGRAWVLNFATGEVEKAPIVKPEYSVQATGKPLQLRDLTPKFLHSVFDEAGYGVELLDDNIISIVTEVGPVQVRVNPRAMLLAFRRQYSATTWDPQEAKRQAKLIERANRLTTLVRFTFDPETGEVTASYAMPLLAGITRPQLLGALRAFVMSTRLQVFGIPGLEIS